MKLSQHQTIIKSRLLHLLINNSNGRTYLGHVQRGKAPRSIFYRVKAQFCDAHTFSAFMCCLCFLICDRCGNILLRPRVLFLPRLQWTLRTPFISLRRKLSALICTLALKLIRPPYNNCVASTEMALIEESSLSFCGIILQQVTDLSISFCLTAPIRLTINVLERRSVAKAICYLLTVQSLC